jgi:[glutamine synthetase] adenylyltransferase / [glutamine synthetase]-adenylyl-L-tyrosine phosphorylase
MRMDELLTHNPLWQNIRPQIYAASRATLRHDRDDLTAQCQALKSLFEHTNIAQLIDGINAHSLYLRDIMRDMPIFLCDVLQRPLSESWADLLMNLDEQCRAAQSDDDIMHVLRRAKKQSALLIAIADIGCVWSLQDVTAALTAFADKAVALSVNFLMQKALREGKFQADVNSIDPASSGFVVLAMGKHGAYELNYSSDIDLIVLYDYKRAQEYIRGEPAPFFVRLTQSMVRLLQERTPDGYVERVDLRLRPDPGSTAVAISLDAAADYYELFGQNWERAALIKARAIAGDISAGQKFLDQLAPFIWRKYFDYAAIADIHAMKRQIHAVRGHEVIKVAGHDIKLGRGGIREVEFFVQTQQLIFGGRRAQLRGSQTLDMLISLCDDGWITAQARDELTAAYIELRRIEHRLQMVKDEQTQRLSSDDAALLSIAQFSGFKTIKAFTNHILKIFNRVEFHYARLFESAPSLDNQLGSLVFTGVTDDPETLETLQKLGFKDPSAAIETIRGWHFGRRASIQSARAREVITELVPLLLQSFSQSGDSDAALRAFDSALANMPAAVELLSILKSNKKLRDIFSDILGGAPRLTEIICSRPHVLDAAIDPLYQEDLFDFSRYTNRLKTILATHQQFEDRLDAFRDMKQEESFLISFRILTESLTAREGAHSYSALAASLINATYQAVRHEFEIEYGVIHNAEYVILGMGKLGSKEMTAQSDLDLVSVYRFDDPNASSSGGNRSLSPAPYFTRLTQRLITALTAATKRGILYEVDMRLRPSGKQGPVASQFQSLHDYYSNEAEFWEHMALTRASVIVGDHGLSADISAFFVDIISKKRDRKSLCSQIKDMKKLVEQEKSSNALWDLKVAQGGLMDIEFMAQMLCLAYAHEYPQLRLQHPRDVITSAQECGLISLEDMNILCGGYDVLTTLQQITHLALREKFDPQHCTASVLKHISSLAHFPDFKSLELALSDYKASVRRSFNALLI